MLADTRRDYLGALRAADRGDRGQFVAFILDRTLDAMGLAEESVRAAVAGDIDDIVSKFRRLYFTPRGYTHRQLDEGATVLINQFHQTLVDRCESLKDLSSVTVSVDRIDPGDPLRSGYRTPAGAQRSRLAAQATDPAQAAIRSIFQAEVPMNDTDESDLVIRQANSGFEFEARMDDLVPSLSGALVMRLRIAVEGIVAAALRELLADAEKSFRRWQQ